MPEATTAGLTTEQPAAATAKPVAATQPATTKKPTVRAAVPVRKGNYCIIVSSLATSADAQQVLNEYKKKGYKEASVIEGSGRYRLSLYSFADKAAAYNKLNELKQNDAFKNAWILNAK